MKRKPIGTGMSLCVQPAFIIGTNNADGSSNFAPITWVSVTCEGGNEYLLVISMYGTKMTKRNVIRTGLLSANLVGANMLPLMDYFGSSGMYHSIGKLLGQIGDFAPFVQRP